MASVRVKILIDFNAPGGRSFRTGQQTVMELDEADEYARAGFLEVLNRSLAVKVVNKPKAGRKAVK